MRQFWIVLLICAISVAARPPKSGRRKTKTKGGDDEVGHTYKYGYKITDEDKNKQTRKEESDGQGNVRGVYGYTDADGIYRQVEYTAGPEGFKAWVKTNEPGTVNANPADADIISEYVADDSEDDDDEDWEDDEVDDWVPPTTKPPSRKRSRPSASGGRRQQTSWSVKSKSKNSRSGSRRSKSSDWD